MPRPPDDDHTSILDQVREALDALDLGQDPTTRAALVEGVDEALRALGLSDPPSDEGPHLRVVDGDESESETRSDSPDIRVRVLSRPAGVEPSMVELEYGRIVVATNGWQSVYRGARPRLYRLFCSEGLLEVSADGVAVEQLRAGQTMDLEAALIRVRGGMGATSNLGAYTRLPPEEPLL